MLLVPCAVIGVREVASVATTNIFDLQYVSNLDERFL